MFVTHKFTGFLLSPAAVLLAIGTAGCSSVPWQRSLESGLTKAAQQQRPALVMFDAAFNQDCREMDREVFSDATVREKLDCFVPIRLDYYWNRKLANEMGVEVLPSFFVFRCDRSIAGSHAGKMNAEQFSFFLIKYRHY